MGKIIRMIPNSIPEKRYREEVFDEEGTSASLDFSIQGSTASSAMGILLDAISKEDSFPPEFKNFIGDQKNLASLTEYLRSLSGLRRGAAYNTYYANFSFLDKEELSEILKQFDPNSELARKFPQYYLAFYDIYKQKR
jgi:hypothetical protein